MESAPPAAGPAAPDPAPAKGQPDLVGLADKLHAKHAQGAIPGRAGRKSREQEVADYLRRNNLKTVAADHAPAAAPNPTPSHVVSPAFVQEMAKLALEGMSAYRQRAAYLKAVAVGADKALAREIGEGNGAPPGAIEVISASLAEISQKYDWLSQWTPEACILCAIGTWVSKDIATMKRLQQLRDETKNPD